MKITKEAILEKIANIDIKPSHKGKLHKALGIPEGEDIPVERLKEAKNSKDPDIRREATFALNARHWHHG